MRPPVSLTIRVRSSLLKVASEFTVFVLPRASWCDLLGRIPMLDQLSVGDTKEVVEG